MKKLFIITLIGLWIFVSIGFLNVCVGSIIQTIEFMNFKKQPTFSKFVYVETLMCVGVTLIWFIVSPKALYKVIRYLAD